MGQCPLDDHHGMAGNVVWSGTDVWTTCEPVRSTCTRSRVLLVVEGKVVDEVGRPLANIRVDLKTAPLGEYVPEYYTDEQGLFAAYLENCTPDFEKDTLQVHFSDMYQIYAPDSLKVPFAEMKIDTIETGIYGCTCNVDMQLTKKEQPTE